ncbi:MAG: response regulator [Owenweeksia sp.]|nr:response regulator [Owenweeksia sp.]
MQKDPNSYRLLLVEDNPGDLFLIRDYLDEEIVSPEILEAGSYKAALETLEQQSQLDVILLDLSLPDKNGEELLRDMLAHSRGTPIIVLTGYTDMRFAVKSLSMGVSDYLLKDSLSSAMLHKSILYSLERNRYLLQIRNSEQRYSDLFHLSPQPMWVYDMQSLHFLDVNEAAVKQYGYSKEEFLKMTIKDIRPSEDLPKLEAALDKSRPHERYYFQGEFRHQKKNGELLIVDVRSNIIYYGERKAELVLATDISEKV